LIGPDDKPQAESYEFCRERPQKTSPAGSGTEGKVGLA